MTNILEVNNISKKIGNFSLENVSFTLEKGEIIGIIGKNGAGKTTLLKLILEIFTADNGSINTISKQDIGVVIGEHVYYENLTCIEMAKILSHFYKKWNWDDFKKYMQEFSLPFKQKIENLSKGMKVKFSLACALSHKAQLLILDEPTSGLDPESAQKVNQLIRNLAKENGMKNGQIMEPVRAALTHKRSSAGGAVELVHIFGKEETLKRLNQAIQNLKDSL